MSGFYQNMNGNGYYGNVDSNQNQQSKDNQLYQAQGNNYYYMNPQNMQNQSKDMNIYEINQRNSLKKLDRNSQVFVPGGGGAQQNNQHFGQQNHSNERMPNFNVNNNFMQDPANIQQMQDMYDSSMYTNNAYQNKKIPQKN